MKWCVRVMAVLICLTMSYLCIPALKINNIGDIHGSKIRYVALGDSIAHGYGLKNPEEESYVAGVKNYLESQYDCVFCFNLGQDGLDSSDLLKRLTDEKNSFYEKYTRILKNADIVTVSIGSNDLLHHVKLENDMRKMIEESDADLRETGEIFADNFLQITKIIHKLSPQAKIYANNVYNPCHEMMLFSSLTEMVDQYISLFNQGFLLKTLPKEVVAVDIKKVLEGTDKELLNASMEGHSLDPHPNVRGHEKIAEAVVEAMKQQSEKLNIHSS